MSSNPWVGPSPRIEISFFLLSICTDEFISTPKIMTFLPMLLSDNENSERNWILCCSLYLHLSGSAFLASLRDPKKQSFKVKSVFKYCDHVSNSHEQVPF